MLVSLTLALVIVTAAATTAPTDQTAWGYTPVVVYLFVHLGLMLLTILARLRTAFSSHPLTTRLPRDRRRQ